MEFFKEIKKNWSRSGRVSLIEELNEYKRSRKREMRNFG